MVKRTFSKKGGLSFLILGGGLLLIVVLLFSMYGVREGFYAEKCGSNVGLGAKCEAAQKNYYCSKSDGSSNKTFLKCTNIGTSKSPEYKWQTTTDNVGTTVMSTGINTTGYDPTDRSLNDSDEATKETGFYSTCLGNVGDTCTGTSDCYQQGTQTLLACRNGFFKVKTVY